MTTIYIGTKLQKQTSMNRVKRNSGTEAKKLNRREKHMFRKPDCPEGELESGHGTTTT